jgi:integrase
VPRIAKPLTALEVKRLDTPGLHAVGTVPGLCLRVACPPSSTRAWILRTVVGERRRDLGLGGYPAVTLAQAIEAARQQRQAVGQGKDLVSERRATKSALRASRQRQITFAKAAEGYIAAHEAGWRNAKHAWQWNSSLELYAFPKIGQLDIGDIGMSHVLEVLEPIWRTKTETASRVRGRIELILAWADKRADRERLNPARWRGHLDTQLPARNKVAKPKHHAALPVADASAFMSALRKQEGSAARALEFVILTAARSGEVRFATWPEIDFGSRTWTVPAQRMKSGREHRVPLSPAAIALLESTPLVDGSEVIFQAPRGGVLSDMALVAVCRRMTADCVPHGFRSTFRDWCAERTNVAREVAEMALAHSIGSEVEAAYRRGDLFDKRRHLMDEWAAFLQSAKRATNRDGGMSIALTK